MFDLILPKEKLISLDDCRLCSEGRNNVGTIGKKAAVIYKTGTDSAIDWFITLQRSNISHPNSGFTLMLLPLGHLTAFSHVNSSRELAQNYGLTFGIANYAMQRVRYEEDQVSEVSLEAEEHGDILFRPTAVIYGKCASAINTQEHFHIKTYTLDGDVDQPSPSDTEWIKRQVFDEPDGRGKYVKALPVVKRELGEERYNLLASRLVEICNNS